MASRFLKNSKGREYQVDQTIKWRKLPRDLGAFLKKFLSQKIDFHEKFQLLHLNRSETEKFEEKTNRCRYVDTMNRDVAKEKPH